MKKINLQIFIILFIILNTAYLFADSITNYTNGNEAQCVLEDGNFIWCGTLGGLMKWDKTNKTFIKYTTKDGLNSNAIKALAKDSGGDLWVGTNDGLLKFDGTNWIDYTDNGYIQSGICAIAVEGSVLWFGSDGKGIVKYDGSVWTTYNKSNSQLTSDYVSAIAVDASNNKWIGTDDKLNKFDGANWVSFSSPTIVGDNIHAVEVDSSGNVWIGTDDGVGKYNGSSGWASYNITNTSGGLGENRVHSIDSKSGTLWFGLRDGGATRFVVATSSWTNFNNTLAGREVYGIAIDASGNTWIGSESGLRKYDGAFTRYFDADTICGNYVYDVFADTTTGKIWFATSDGVSSFDVTASSWVTYNTSNSGLANNNVHSVFVDDNGIMWCGSSGGINSFNGSVWYTSTTSNSKLSDNYVKDIIQDKYGWLWTATENGVSSYSTMWSSYTNSSTSGGLISDKIRGAASENFSGALYDGYKWFATDQGVSRYRSDTGWSSYTTSSGLVDNDVYSACVDKDGNAWFGTKMGVSKFNGSSWTNHSYNDNKDLYYVRAVVGDAGGNIWAGSSYGASKYDGNEWTLYSPDDGLVNRVVLSLAIDKDGNLWVGTSNGVSKFAYSALHNKYIKGKVSDVNGRAIEGATVVLTGKTSKTTYTDVSGNYELTGIGYGYHTVTVTKKNYGFSPEDRSAIIEQSVSGWNFTGAYSSADISPAEIDITLGAGGKSVTVKTPESKKVKLISEASTAAMKGVLNSSKGDRVAIIFRPDRAPSDYIGKEYEIKIFNLAGELIEEFTKTPEQGDDIWITWTPQNIASGIYLIHVEGDGVKDYKKAAVVR
ncbi:MAG: two-component regulator propeller domain-containing protein [Elusimicrobiota bacterium]